MKSNFVIFFLLLLLKQGTAQTNVYHAFPDSNACWHENYAWGTTCAVFETQFHNITGDTVIGPYTYHILSMSGYYSCGSYPPVLESGKHFIRQNVVQKKVYMYATNFYADTILYDFNLITGNTFNNSINNYKITKVDSVLIGSSYRKRWWTDQTFGAIGNGDTAISIIEGIGSTAGLFFNMQGVEYGSVLTSSTQNGQCLYNISTSPCVCSSSFGVNEIKRKELSYEILPNPFSNRFILKGQTELGTVKVFTLTGELIYSNKTSAKEHTIDLSNSPSGVYILQVQDFHTRIIKE